MRGNCPPFLALVDEEELFDFDLGEDTLEWTPQGINALESLQKKMTAPGTAMISSRYGKSVPFTYATSGIASQSSAMVNLSSASNKATTSTSYNATSLR